MEEKKLRYGMITIHDTLNYGSLLQAFSLYKALEVCGCDIELIDYHNDTIEKRESTYGWKEIRKVSDVARHVLYHGYLKHKKSAMREFLKNQVRLSKAYDAETINKANACYDAFVVGSDIVWGPKITGEDTHYMLDFTEEAKYRMAFSSSVGDIWSAKEQQQFLPLLRRFQTITLRERGTAEWLSELLGNKIPATCDPTMLWKEDFWRQFLLHDYGPKEKYVLIYTHTKDKKNIQDAVQYGKKHGMKVYYINHGRPEPGTHNIKPVSPEEWLTLIANAEVVFSASFHGLVFALYYHVPVFYYSRAHSERMRSLAEDLHITFRQGNTANIKADQNMNFERIDELMNVKQLDSWRLLQEMVDAL